MKFLNLLIAACFSFTAWSATVDTKESVIQWTGKKKVGSQHSGKVSFKKADLKTNEKGEITGGTFVVDMHTITVEDLEGEWKSKFLNHMKSDDFFDVKNHAEATLVIDRVKDGKAHGELAIRGKKQKVQIPFKEKDGFYEGTLTFDRTKFGLIYGSKNFFKKLVADKIIENEVTLDFKIKVEKEDSKKKESKKTANNN